VTRAARALRRRARAFAICAALLTPAAAAAAPTCLDSTGATVRCESPTALPVGESPPAPDLPRSDIPLPAPETLFGLICILGGLFALIGLMPDFDGWGPGEQDGRRKSD
jgi:hypothetical protein